MEFVDDNFLTRLVKDMTKGGTLLGLILIKEKELVGNMKVRGSLDCTDYGMPEFKILGERNKANCRITTSGLQKSGFWPVQKSPWKNAMGYDPRELCGGFR